jgi:hypothetical protein
MEPGERIMETGWLEVRDQRLEPAESPADLIGMMHILDPVENDPVLDKMKYPPAAAVSVNMVRTAASFMDQRRGNGVGVGHPLRTQPGNDVPRHHLYVLHHVDGMLEDRAIDALEHILADLSADFERAEVGIVDQSGAEFFDRGERAGDRKIEDHVFGPVKHGAL